MERFGSGSRHDADTGKARSPQGLETRISFENRVCEVHQEQKERKRSQDYEKQLLRILERISRTMQARCEILCLSPSPAEIIPTLALRYHGLATGTYRMEVLCMRQILRAVMLPADDEDRALAEQAIDRASWLEALQGETDHDVLSDIERRPLDIARSNASRFTTEMNSFQDRYPESNQRGIIETLMGRRRKTRSKRNKGAVSLEWRDFRAIDMALAQEDPWNSLRILHDTASNQRGVTGGLLKLFATTIWLTGMRPIEVWSCQMLAPNPEILFDDRMRKLIHEDPASAIIDRLLLPVEQVHKQLGQENYTMSWQHAIEQSRASAVMAIRNAKTHNANPDLKTKMRFQVLANIPANHVGILCIAGQLRRMSIPGPMHDSLRAAMTARLKRIVQDTPEIEISNVNLYSLRHAFATRARRIYTPYEVASLMGHTSLESTTGYGYSHAGRMRQPIRLQDEWIPAPDRTHARALMTGLKPGMEKSPGTSPDHQE